VTPRAGPPPPRAIVDAVLPVVDCGRFAVKRVVGEPLVVDAHCFGDGHDKLRAVLRWRAEGDAQWQEVEMAPLGNDEWQAAFIPPSVGRYAYAVTAWVDPFVSWRADFERRVELDDLRVALAVGAELAAAAARRARGTDRKALTAWAVRLRHDAGADAADAAALRAVALDLAGAELAARYPDRRTTAASSPEYPLVVDRERAGFSAWYELFPRSAGAPGRHGTLADVQARLPAIAAMGFDVVYLPPIHPIGRVNRKGRNNALEAEPGDVGSPWAIGAEEGGHKDVLPALGTLDDVRALVAAATALGIDIALDIAFQCAPDHPYVAEHPQWFRARPDGSIQYAENPPKKYQDIYPFDFESADWAALWIELKSVLDHWIAHGVRVFRVDNPHTKAFAFWEWAIAEVRKADPDVIFLAEAFTRPKVMHRLAKLGFSQSYTYFTWRHTRQELTDYFSELAHGPGSDYFRPNVWPNTPDILDVQLHDATRAAFAIRFVLAATLAPNYGIYGPAFELLENRPRSPGSEEYLDSEKYQLRAWDLERDESLRDLITTVNAIRKAHAAFRDLRSLAFLGTDNDQLIAWCKRAPAGDDTVLVVVNLDPHNRQSGWVEVDAERLGIDPAHAYQLHDLLSGRTFAWQGRRGFVILDPAEAPAHVCAVQQALHSERDFDREH
jgi:starch synthase (maltosyl-transferring)